MADASNYLSTPDGYATPTQVSEARQYAQALMSGKLQQPVQHWTQGVSNMVSALVGGNLAYTSGQKERAAMADLAKSKASNIPDSNYTDGALPLSPASGGAPSGKRADVDTGNTDTNAKAIASIESDGSGGYNAIGPAITNPKSAYYGDHAHGKYQVMGKNIPEWTKDVLGKAMTPDEFRANPAAQDAVFKAKFKSPSEWFTGRTLENGGANASDGHITGAQYAAKFAKAGGTTPSAFTGPADASQAPAVQAISAALRGQPPIAGGGTQVAGDPQLALRAPAAGQTNPAPRVLPDPANNGQSIINPSLVKPPPGYSKDNLQRVMSNPWASPAEREQAYQMALQQGQPIFMPSPTGSGKILLDPRNPGTQQFFADPPHWGEKKISADGITEPTATTIGPAGQAIVNPQVRPSFGPRSDAAPVTGGPAGIASAEPAAAAPDGAAPAGVAPAPALAENAPAAPAGAPDQPVQVASTDPTAGVAATAGKPAVPAPAAVAQASPLAALASADKVPPGISPQDWQTINMMGDAKAKREVNKDSQVKAADFAAKKYDTLSGQAQAARKQMPNLDLGLALMNDPNFHTGMLAGAQDQWSRFKSLVLGDKYANAPNETFDKIMAGTILDNMKTALGGLGQVRLAEISLLTKANANRTNTDASNRAVLEVSRRAVQSIDHLDQIGQAYASGDEVTDPLSGKVLLPPNLDSTGEIIPRHGLDAGYDKLARKFVMEHPSFTPEEVKHYETIFDTGRDPSQKAAETGAAPAAPKAGDTKMFPDGKGGTVEGVFDGTKWGPKK